MWRQIIRLLMLVISAFIIAGKADAQDLPSPNAASGSRSITSDDFNKKRQAKPQSKTTVRVRDYKFVRIDKNALARKKAKPISGTIKPVEKTSEIGVTIWKLRPPLGTDAGIKLPVQLIKNDTEREMWTPERVGIDSEFKAGDRVRIAVESSIAGYLYVINNEMRAGDTLGKPVLLFPQRPRDENAVKPGMLVDFPDQTDDMPYFDINPKNADYRGEMLTIIVSPTRLTNLETNEDGEIANIDEIAGLDSETDAEIFSRVDKDDLIYTKVESQSACGAQKRQLERKKPATGPCGAGTRQLTRSEPLPQTLVRVKTAGSQPVIASVKMMVKL